MVEAIDAAQALEHVDVASRSMVKTALGATLVKSARNLPAFETAFEAYFSLLGPTPGSAEAAERLRSDLAAIGEGAGVGGAADLDALVEALFRALRDGDQGLAGAVSRQAVSRLAGIEPGRPVGGAYYLYRVLRSIDLAALEERLVGELAPGPGEFEHRLAQDEAQRRIEEFREAVRAEIHRRLVADRGPEAVARTMRRPLVEDLDLVSATRDDLAAIEALVHPLTRKLATRLARRRRLGRIGRLDVRRTVRRSLSTGGVPVDPRFRRPRSGRPDIVILADISGSVATFARFTMQVVFAMSAQFRRVRSFAFIDTIDEVTDFFGAGADFAEAMRRIGSEAGVVWLDGHSDYGNAFLTFRERFAESISPKTTVIVTGDARTNYHSPNVAALGDIAAGARALYWLNPEARRYWDTGDSVMGAYAAVCDEVHEVRNLRQLAGFVEQVALPVSRPVRRLG
ncbi:MAG: VWA domain-containing protein [Acidimicrobiia bacterium]|nr:VWA domain-containing protein [Acidimicrobiia bacterium]